MRHLHKNNLYWSSMKQYWPVSILSVGKCPLIVLTPITADNNYKWPKLYADDAVYVLSFQFPKPPSNISEVTGLDTLEFLFPTCYGSPSALMD